MDERHLVSGQLPLGKRAASFPARDADRIRTVFRADLTTKDNKLGVQANERDGQIYFRYRRSIFSALRM